MASFLLLSLMSHCFLRGSKTDSKGSEASTATIPVIAELLELLFLSDQPVSVCPISISIHLNSLSVVCIM